MDANREERWTLVVALAALMALIFLRNGWMVRACVDDAYIFLRYAHNTLNGDFYAWNPGKGPADGVTAPLWLAVCVVATAAADWMRSDPVLMLRHALMISAGFWLFALYRLGRSAWPAGPRPVHGLWIGLWLLLDPAFEAAARSGMETLLAVALTALSLHLFLRLERLLDSVNKTPETGRLPWGAAAGAGLVAFACVLVRPEMGLYALGAPALLLFKHRSRSTGGGRVFGMALGVVVAAGALYALFKVVVVGSLIPWPAYIKSGGHMIYENYDTESERELHGLAFEYLRHYAPFLIALPVAIATPGLRRDTAWIWAPLMGLIVY